MDKQGPQRERSEGSALAEKRMTCFYLVAALILTLAVRLYLFGNYHTINNDGVYYIEMARHFWQGQWVEALASYFAPLFPLMIDVIYPLLGEWELAGQFWPFTLGVLMLVPLFGLLRALYGPKVARLALIFYAVSPYLARLSLHVRSEIPYIFFFLLALYMLQLSVDGRRLLPLFLMGLCSALAYLLRPEGIGLVIVASLFLGFRAWSRKELRKVWLRVATLCLGFALFSFPYPFYLRWDTGNWLISRKTTVVFSAGIAEYDQAATGIPEKGSGMAGVMAVIAERPILYTKKVAIDTFRSLVVYFEALHYSYLPFLFVGWFFFFRGRFWEKKDFILGLCVIFYLLTFAFFTVNRRFAVPLVPLSLGWVSVGYLAISEYFRSQWGEKGRLFSSLLLVFFFAATLPKTLKAIGREKLYLRKAGLYLMRKPGNPVILTNNGRVAFYARGGNRILIKNSNDFPDILAAQEGDYLALDGKVFDNIEHSLDKYRWLLDREFSNGRGSKLLVLRQAESN